MALLGMWDCNFGNYWVIEAPTVDRLAVKKFNSNSTPSLMIGIQSP